MPPDDVLGDVVPGAGAGADAVHLELEDFAVEVEQRGPCSGLKIGEGLGVGPGGGEADLVEVHVPGDAAGSVEQTILDTLFREDSF